MAAARVDLPTPPLPEPTAITFLTLGISPFSVIPLPRTSALMATWKVQSAPRRLVKAVRTSCSIWALSGQAGVVRLIVSVLSAMSPSPYG